MIPGGAQKTIPNTSEERNKVVMDLDTLTEKRTTEIPSGSCACHHQSKISDQQS